MQSVATIQRLYPVVQGWSTSMIRPTKYLAHFLSTTFPTVDSSATALATACVKQKYKHNCVIFVITALQHISTTFFCIDFVNRTVSCPSVARHSRIGPLGQKFGHLCRSVWDQVV